MYVNSSDKIEDGDKWLNSLVNSIAESSGMIVINDSILIDPSEIASIKFKGHFERNPKAGAVDLKIFLRGGGSIDIEGLGRERIDSIRDSFNKALIKEQPTHVTRSCVTR